MREKKSLDRLEGYIPLDAAAEKYFFAKETLITWAQKKYFYSYYQSRRWYFHESSLQNFIDLRSKFRD